MVRRLTVLLVMLCAGTAGAAGPTVSAVTGKVTLVKNGASREAKAGDAIAKEDFLRIDEGASVTITLPDSKTVEVKGKALVPGRRLQDSKLAAGIAKFAVALQAVAGKQDGGAAPASMSDLSTGSDPSRKVTEGTISSASLKDTKLEKAKSGAASNEASGGKTGGATRSPVSTADAPVVTSEKGGSWWWPFGRKKAVPPAAETTVGSSKKSTNEDDRFEEEERNVPKDRLALSRPDGAGDGAQPARPPVSPLDGARAFAKADRTADALAELDALIAAKATQPGALAEALVLRARLRLQTGAEDATVRDDLERAIKTQPGSESAHEAAFLLGVLALSSGKDAEAKRLFGTIPADHALRTQAQSLLDAK